jgi:hypothetical protein
MFCREQVARFGHELDRIEGLGARLIAIGNGTPEMAQDFVEQFGVKFSVFTDPQRASYRAAGLRTQNFLQLSGLGTTLENGWRALKGGFRQGRTKGNPFQNGGVMVIDTDGTILMSHAEAVAGDLAEPRSVIDVLRERAAA